MKKNKFYLVISLTILISNILYGAIPASERSALIALYNSTNGDSWTNNGVWKTPPLHIDGFAMPGTEGTWYGITVSLDHVASIYIKCNNLIGSIPPELGNLSNLNELVLSDNHLNGNIPPGLGNLINLEYLYINKNKLSREIPKNLMNLSKLSIPNVHIGHNCLYTNDAELKTWLNSIDPCWEQNQKECTSPEISVNRTSLNFGYITGSSNMSRETFTIYNSGGGTLNWSVNTKIEHFTLSPTSGTGYGVVEVTINPVGLLPAKYEGVIYVIDPLASNSPVEVKINLWVKTGSQSSPPFGDFATPINNSTVRSSIPVTGWVLGDTGMDSVKIYREQDGGKSLAYIGDAIFVEGARPDVEAAYPDYPMNYKAGWGYMMLTNCLPNGANGTFKIHAIAKDREGQTKTLGVKTIIVDNAHAIKPFGAIDTPTQGGTASGSDFIN